VVLGQVFLKVFLFSAVIIPPMLHTFHLFTIGTVCFYNILTALLN
jgi:hypothetical protein